jgi:uncharacterized protein (TIGR02594 family)
MPPWLKIAYSLIGTKEFAGAPSNPTILDWAKKLGGWFASFYKDDSIPWCGLFVAHCIQEAGFKFQNDALSALGWSDYGRDCEASPGAILVFKRDGGGHVGFYVSEDKETYHVLGGNQSDMVTISKISKDRLVTKRWPNEFPLPKVGAVQATLTAPITRNER